MMKIFTTIMLMMGIGLPAVNGQTEKNLVFDNNAEVRKVTGFNSVDVSGAIDLYLSQGNEEAVAVSASSDEVMSRIRTELRGSTLHIYFDNNGMSWRKWGNYKMKAYVTFKNLKSIEASGACNVKTTEPVKLRELKIQMSGASDFKGSLSVTDLRLDVSGASQISLSGTAVRTDIDASGASDIKAYDLRTDLCRAGASGATVVRITVNKELKADASGGSSIYYRGEGLIRDINTSGGATIKRKMED